MSAYRIGEGPRVADLSAARPVPLVAKPLTAPIACTLDADAMPDRLADWRAVLDRAQARATAEDGALRVELAPDVDLGELARLVAAEQRCCAFFAFAINVDHRGLALEVRAPEGAEDLVAVVFGDAAQA